MPHLIRLSEARSVETPAATMRTYVSPSLESSVRHAVWRTEVPAGGSGPLHTVDTDHVVVVIEGSLEAIVDNEAHDVAAGDCLLLPAGSVRQLTGGPAGATTVTSARAGSNASVGGGNPVHIPWAN